MASPHHVLILGGHGKIAQFLTPLLLQRSWTVTSMIRAQEQVPAIEKLGSGQPGKLNVLVSSLDEVDSQEHAAGILNQVKPDYVAWSAGVGGKGGPEATFRVDRDAAIHFINAASSIPSITRFLLISYNGARRAAAPWWSPSEWDEYNRSLNHGSLATYYKAKLAADQALYETSRRSSTMTCICLRPSTLTDAPAGKISLGKNAHVRGETPRESVAQVASALLASEGVRSGWIDMMGGDDEIDQAVQKVIRDGVDAAEGEPIYKP